MLTHTHTHTHTIIGSQMEQYAEHVPSNSTRLSRRCMDATPYHIHTQIHTHTSAYTAARMHAQIAKQNNTTLSRPLSLSHTYTHTDLISIILFISLPSRCRMRRGAAHRLCVPLDSPPHFFSLFISPLFSHNPLFPSSHLPSSPRCEHSLANIR